MKLSVLLSIIILLTITGCSKEENKTAKDPKPVSLTEKSREVISVSNDFGIRLFTQAALTEDDNMMLSPLSASAALSMLLNGCEGETYNQIRSMLGFEGMSPEEINESYQSLTTQLLNLDTTTRLALANAVWYRQGFAVKSPFLSRLEEDFDATCAALDFNSPGALETINGWASDNTNGKIDEVLQEISPEAVMFIMNALYFKGTWTQQFDKSKTTTGLFRPENGPATEVDMMSGTIPVRSYYGSTCSALELNYGQQNFSMVIILPGGTLTSFLGDFTPELWETITSGLDANTSQQSLDIRMPKFRFEFEKTLNDQLSSLGMTDAFNPVLADLSGIADDDIFVSFVKQNTFVDVNEEGTEAAAVTTIGIELTSFPEPTVIDRPFVFAIRERLSNTLLFIGKVELPEYD